MSLDNGWATAQAPRFVSGPAPSGFASPAQKAKEAEALRAAVEAHMRNGGAVEHLPATGSPASKGRRRRAGTAD